MSKVFSFIRSHLAALCVALAGLVVVGVGYFDTYPTYFATNVTLSETECSQVAVLVAAHQFKRTSPDVAVPESAVAEMAKSTRLAKRVAKYIIEKSQIPEGVPAGYLYTGIYQSCLMSEGKAELK